MLSFLCYIFILNFGCKVTKKIVNSRMFSTDDKLKNAKSTFFLPAFRPYKTYGMGSGLLDVVTQLLMYML